MPGLQEKPVRQADDTGRGRWPPWDAVDGDPMEARMHDLAITVLASGGKGGHRLVLAALIVVIVLFAGGWALYAARARARGKRP
jgi:hypothetical protein